MILVDANTLVYLNNQTSPHHPIAGQALATLYEEQDEDIVLCPQALYEAYVVFTRPAAQRGVGLLRANAIALLESLTQQFLLLPDRDSLYATWLSLLRKHEINGKRAHDARYTAFMLDYGIDGILTFNDIDFRWFRDGSIINPYDLLGKPRPASPNHANE